MTYLDLRYAVSSSQNNARCNEGTSTDIQVDLLTSNGLFLQDSAHVGPLTKLGRAVILRVGRDTNTDTFLIATATPRFVDPLGCRGCCGGSSGGGGVRGGGVSGSCSGGC